jgi:hypothetical protein
MNNDYVFYEYILNLAKNVRFNKSLQIYFFFKLLLEIKILNFQ